MLESVFNISIAALIAGFVFAMPIAGPISILIVSNALNGKRHYSNLVSIGAATSDSLYVFIAVYGLTRFYSFYKPAIPYLFLIGSLFFIYLSHKIYNTKIDLEQLEEETHVPEKIRNRDRGGFYTGFMINLLNPTLFLSGLISAFFVISFVASLGLNTGGLNLHMNANMKEISSIEGKEISKDEPMAFEALKKIQNNNGNNVEHKTYPSYFHAIISICYALFIALGGMIWFRLFVWILNRYRKKINFKVLSVLIKAFGLILFLLGLYFGYLGGKILL